MAHGITNLMNNIPGPKVKKVHTNVGLNRQQRRSTAKTKRNYNRVYLGKDVQPGTDVPFVNYEKQAERRRKLAEKRGVTYTLTPIALDV